MKITWDNIDCFIWSDRANAFRYNNRSYILIEEYGCKNCKSPFMTEKCVLQRNDYPLYCCRECQLSGKNNPNYKNRGKDSPLYKKISYRRDNIPRYDTYQPQLEPYGVECRRNKEDNNILEVKCMYCGRWHIPKLQNICNKINAINGKTTGDYNLYCSDECKHACPIYRQKIYPKDFKLNTSREVQPALRKLVLERDNYTCQKCDATDKELHCHHYEGIEVNPIESADIDMCVTLCKDCHNEIHTNDKCGMKDYKRGKCNE